MIELCQHACTIYPASVPVTDLLSIRSYRQGLESCSYCYIDCARVEHSCQRLLRIHIVFCATLFTALTTTALMKEVSFLQFQSSAPSYLLAHCPVQIHTIPCASLWQYTTSLFLAVYLICLCEFVINNFCPHLCFTLCTVHVKSWY